MVVAEGWSRLPEHWCGAFRQAWAAYVAGTIPVGAVVVDPHGAIAAEARNRIFDPGAPPPGQLAGSWLAHAELNALAQIDAKRSRTAEGWAVYSTLEPCPLCAGAITVAFRGRITVGYASGDPVSGGGLRALTGTDMGHRRQWQIQKLSGPFVVFAELLHAVYTVEARPTSLTAAFYREPPWRLLIETTGAVLARARDRGEAVEQVVATIWPAIAHAQVGPASEASSEAG
ncbi:MAG TPA: deaminase [Candidatus Tectomicrobia bacterium]|nr:deaminase [Candidatus Tectomicrobia bacterium]